MREVGRGWVLWHDLNNGKGTSDLELGMLGVYVGQVD